ncbi:MAG: hypothetical protein IPI65_16725 [Bacteroidetes bacterium]|nr:hypothetical protein [Bacteroidota bacterium]
MNEIAKGTTDRRYHGCGNSERFENYTADSYFMNFTSNHDENSWNGTEFERMGNGAKTFAVMAATIPGMLLMYSGQEVALDRRLKFFDKDPITWVDTKLHAVLYNTYSIKRR